MSANENSAYKKAQELAAESKHEAALVAYEEALRKQPHNYQAAFGAGMMLQRLDRHKEAIARLSSVIRTHPDLAEAHYSRALSLQSLKQHAQALTDLDRALAIQPGYADARCAQGHSLKALGRQAEAMQAYSATIARSPLYLPALRGRATIKYAFRDFDGAVADFGICISNGLDSYEVRLLRGLAFFNLGRLQEAVADLSHAISFRPEDGSTYIRRWQAYVSLGDEDNAKKDFVTGNRLLAAASATAEPDEPPNLNQAQEDAGLTQMVEFMQTRNAHKRRSEDD